MAELLAMKDPYSLEAEQAILGSILLNNRNVEKLDFLRGEHFYSHLHETIYSIANNIISRGMTANPITIWDALKNDEIMIKAGGRKYLTDLTASSMVIPNIADYGHLIVDRWERRQIIEAAKTAMADCNADFTKDASVIRSTLESALMGNDLQDGAAVSFAVDDVADDVLVNMQTSFQNRGKPAGLTTGMTDLDRITGGVFGSELIIIAGRPGMGKTAFGVSVAVNQAKSGKRVGFFSLEMSKEELGQRILSMESGVPVQRVTCGNLTAEDMNAANEARQRLREYACNIRVDDTGGLTIASIRNRARRWVRKFKLDAVMVDHIGLVRDSGRNMNRVHQIEEITKSLKEMAKELNIPVYALCQLSRAVEGREDKRPTISDLRDSGSIEQDANAVWLLYREAYYLAKDIDPASADKLAEVANLAEVIVGKNRRGECRSSNVFFDAPLMKFGNLEYRNYERPEIYQD